MKSSPWNALLLDAAAVPVPLDEGRFTRWLAAQRVFVSSAMDGELTPFRDAVRAFLSRYGPGVPVMWETLGPLDLGPRLAYLTGVDRSTLFLLVLGTSYGVADETGYSPTHQEANRAAERPLPRMLFTLPAAPASRDGKLNRWIQELHKEVSGKTAGSPGDLVTSLDARLRDLASRSERLWIKLGDCVFPGTVRQEAERHGGRKFKVTARAHDHRVRHALMSINDSGNRRGDLRLTWPDESHPVEVTSVGQTQHFVGEVEVEIACQAPQNYGGGLGRVLPTYNGVSPGEQARRWLRRVLFGEGSEVANDSMTSAISYAGPPLPEILSSVRATGWQAEGVTRLFAVEELARTCGGRFTRLRVGSAAGGAILLNGEFALDGYGGDAAGLAVEGVVPLTV